MCKFPKTVLDWTLTTRGTPFKHNFIGFISMAAAVKRLSWLRLTAPVFVMKCLIIKSLSDTIYIYYISKRYKCKFVCVTRAYTSKVVGLFHVNKMPDFKIVCFLKSHLYEKFSLQLIHKSNSCEISFNFCLYLGYGCNPLLTVKMQLCGSENILKGRYISFFSCSMVHISPLYIWLFQTKALRNYLIIWSYCIIYFHNTMPCTTQYCCFDVHLFSPPKNSNQVLSTWNYWNKNCS